MPKPEDPMHRHNETRAVAAFIHGYLAMLVSQEGVPGLTEVNIEQPTDGKGEYLPYFVIITESGLRVRVSVEPDPTDRHD